MSLVIVVIVFILCIFVLLYTVRKIQKDEVFGKSKCPFSCISVCGPGSKCQPPRKFYLYNGTYMCCVESPYG